MKHFIKIVYFSFALLLSATITIGQTGSGDQTDAHAKECPSAADIVEPCAKAETAAVKAAPAKIADRVEPYTLLSNSDRFDSYAVPSGVDYKKTKTTGVFQRRTADTITESLQQQANGDDAQALAKKLSNPIASLISLPFQSNFDFGMGPDGDGFRYTLNIQPVIPISLTKDWNMISRTILPIIAQDNVVGTSSQFGLGDTVQSFFFSPNKTEPFIWGAGPQFLIPTATDEFLGSQKFGLGPTFVILKQKGKWTVGALINHMWSVAGKDERADVSSTYGQPFISYTTKTAWTFGLNTESTYDWTAKTWNVPIHLSASKLVRFGKQPVSLGGTLRCWAHSAPGGPQWCGFRLIFTPLFPKG